MHVPTTNSNATNCVFNDHTKPNTYKDTQAYPDLFCELYAKAVVEQDNSNVGFISNRGRKNTELNAMDSDGANNSMMMMVGGTSMNKRKRNDGESETPARITSTTNVSSSASTTNALSSTNTTNVSSSGQNIRKKRKGSSTAIAGNDGGKRRVVGTNNSQIMLGNQRNSLNTKKICTRSDGGHKWQAVESESFSLVMCQYCETVAIWSTR